MNLLTVDEEMFALGAVKIALLSDGLEPPFRAGLVKLHEKLNERWSTRVELHAMSTARDRGAK